MAVLITLFFPFLIAVILSCVIQLFISKHLKISLSFWLFSFGNLLLSFVIPIFLVFVFSSIFRVQAEDIGFITMIDVMLYPGMLMITPFGLAGVHFLAEHYRKKKQNHQERDTYFDAVRVEDKAEQPDVRKEEKMDKLGFKEDRIPAREETNTDWFKEEETKSDWFNMKK